jgi:prepilin-type N-terminal cleavage/methylation domain-containing protein
MYFLAQKIKVIKLKRYQSSYGFTLIEMMVALSLFTVVMLASTGVMLVVLDANRKAQSFQVAMDNLGVALESISRDMRVGTHYYCFSDSVPQNYSFSSSQDCDSQGGTSFAFLPLGVPNLSNNYWVYRLTTSLGKGVLERCKPTINISCTDSGAQFTPLTAPEINIKSFRIYVTDSAPKSAGNLIQSKARIVLEGIAGTQLKTQTEFSVQTTISQFQLDI